MSLVFGIDVRWPSGRLVHVRCKGIDLLARQCPGRVTSLGSGDVASLDSFHNCLRKATRAAPDGETATVVGLEPDVLKILELLDIEGPPPEDPITVALERK